MNEQEKKVYLVWAGIKAITLVSSSPFRFPYLILSPPKNKSPAHNSSLTGERGASETKFMPSKFSSVVGSVPSFSFFFEPVRGTAETKKFSLFISLFVQREGWVG